MPHARHVVVPLLGVVVLVVAVWVSGCSRSGDDPASADTAEPDVGACRLLSADDVAKPSNDTQPVPCDEPHTAQTYEVGPLPSRLVKAPYDDQELSSYAYRICSQKFMRFTGADESLAM